MSLKFKTERWPQLIEIEVYENGYYLGKAYRETDCMDYFAADVALEQRIGENYLDGTYTTIAGCKKGIRALRKEHLKDFEELEKEGKA